jgi:vancomycin permeability regulator SanA
MNVIKKIQYGIIVTGSAAVCFLMLINSCSFSARASRKLLSQAANNPYDLIVVPGVPFENNLWSRTMKGRVYWSKYLFDRGIAKNIMYSGSSVYSPYYEATIMSLYAAAIGIPREHIFTEIKAEHSTENVYYSYFKAKKLGFHRIALASDPFQTKALRSFIRKKLSSDVGLIPFVIDTLKKMEREMKDPVIDAQQAFNRDFIPLSKREGFWKRLRGTRGLNIDTTAYK